MAETWDEIRKKARNIENEIDLKLVALSKISSGHGSSSDTTSLLLSTDFTFDTISLEINDKLSKLLELNEKMVLIPLTNSAMIHTQKRHKEILDSYRTEFNKITQNYSIKLEREELLRGSGLMNSSSSSSNSLSRRDMYVKESQHISNSHNMINDQISIAIETQKSLKGQRKAFKKFQNRFNNLANSFPRINSLVQRINIKKRRDSFILGLVIVACVIFMLVYALH